MAYATHRRGFFFFFLFFLFIVFLSFVGVRVRLRRGESLFLLLHKVEGHFVADSSFQNLKDRVVCEGHGENREIDQIFS